MSYQHTGRQPFVYRTSSFSGNGSTPASAGPPGGALTRGGRQGTRTVAFVGKLSLEKGVHCLIAALPAIVAAFPDAHLLIIGDGVARSSLERMLLSLDRGDLHAATQALAEAPTAAEEEAWIAPVTLFWEYVDRVTYQAAARAADLVSHVTFTGYLSHAEIAGILPDADLLVIPSLVKEAFPLVSLEALACGVPPAGPYRGGLIPILDEIAATLGPVADLIRLDPHPEAFVADLAHKVPGLLEYLSRPDVREDVARQCWAIAAGKYDWDRVVDRVESVYRDVLTQARPAD